MKNHLVWIFGTMAFFNCFFHSKNVKHYSFGPLNYRINLYRVIYYLLFRIIIKISNSCFLHEGTLQWASNNQTS